MHNFGAFFSQRYACGCTLQMVVLRKVTIVVDLEVLCLRRDDLSGIFSAMHALQHSLMIILCPEFCDLSPLCLPVPMDLQRRQHRCSAGTDVARKVVILAREAGLKLELEDVDVQSLVPEPLRAAGSTTEFLDALPQVHLSRVSVSEAWQVNIRSLQLEDMAVQSLVAEPLTAGVTLQHS